MAVEPIAIIGMAGRFPQADGLREFWTNLVAGRDCMTELDDEDLLRYHERPELIAHPGYVRRRPVVAESDMFDAELFGVTPREAEVRDPQFRLMLETVHATLEHAGYDPQRYPHEIGLFASANTNRYRYDYIEQNPEFVDAVGFNTIDFSNNTDYVSTFISYKLRLRGPSATILTACSSSLVALHMACTAIRVGDCDMALAGGVDLEFPYHRGYVPIPGEIRSKDGAVRAFSADANGTNFGDGVGAVLLKPLSAALRDNDTVHAVVLGSAVNNDGSRKVGYTAPSIAGQADCIRRALANSGVQPADISYIEAHATGTPVGDPIEVAGLLEAYRTAGPDPLGTGFCAIGSVKSNIGHLGQAAGIAGLIKTVLALTHRQLPPTINVSAPNSEFDWAASPFFLNTSLRDWPTQPGRPRRAGVSSFGIGGTNAHAVLEEAPSRVDGPRRPRPVEVLTWSAASPAAETQLRERLADHFQTLPEEDFADAAYTLRVGRTVQRVRGALVATGSADAGRRLGDAKHVRTGDDVAREIVFTFPGQGAQQPGMFRDLYEDEPLFRSGCDAAFEVLRPLLDRDLRTLWLSPEPDLTDTEVAQPLLYVLESTLAHCLMHWGVQPDVLIGHSLGELVAGAVAGVLDFEDGLRAVAHRARAIGRAPRGRMLAVGASAEAVQDELTERVVVAAVNSPREVVLSGPEAELRAIAERLAGRGLLGRELSTSHAFHSPAMAGAAQDWEVALRDLRLRPPAIPMVSAATGAMLKSDDATSPRFWAGQIVAPVRFAAAADELIERGPAHVLEVGPGRTLVTLLRSSGGGRTAGSRFLPTTGGERGVALQTALAQLWADGVPVGAWEQDSERGYRRVVVPGYPYQRRRYWVDRANVPAPAAAPSPEVAPVALANVADAAATAAAETGPRWRLAHTRWIRSTTAGHVRRRLSIMDRRCCWRRRSTPGSDRCRAPCSESATARGSCWTPPVPKPVRR